MEIDPAYVDVIVRRWEQLTGRDAVHAADGHTFSQLKEGRDGR